MSLYNTVRRSGKTYLSMSMVNAVSASSPKETSKNARDASTMPHRNVEKIIVMDRDHPEIKTEITEGNDADIFVKALFTMDNYIREGRRIRALVHYRGTVLRIGFPK